MRDRENVLERHGSPGFWASAEGDCISRTRTPWHESIFREVLTFSPVCSTYGRP